MVGVLDKITQYIDRNFYPFIITVLAHVVIVILFFLLHLTIETPAYEVVMELDPEMLEELLEDLEEDNEIINDVLAHSGNEMLSNQASADGYSDGSSGGGSGTGVSGNYGMSPQETPQEVRTFDWQHDNIDADHNSYTSPSELDAGDVFVGESTTKYNIANNTRFAVIEPKPHYMCPDGGTVRIDVVVNKSGRVTKAEVNEEKSDTNSECVVNAGLEYAKGFVFTEGTQKDTGYILFVMQRQ